MDIILGKCKLLLNNLSLIEEWGTYKTHRVKHTNVSFALSEVGMDSQFVNINNLEANSQTHDYGYNLTAAALFVPCQISISNYIPISTSLSNASRHKKEQRSKLNNAGQVTHTSWKNQNLVKTNKR